MTKTIGEFQLGKVIGEGTFGKVRRALHLPSGQFVAIKVLQKKRIQDKKDLSRIEKELQILKEIDHPNIIQLLELHETASKIYIITQLAQGQELYQKIVKEQKISQEQSGIYFKQLVSAVSYLHDRNICHRDIKPENIIVSGDRLKLIDFGLSSRIGKNGLMSTACGSPCYAAPEMLDGKSYNAKAIDIWAMGITLYAMLSGNLPFQHSSTPKLYKIINKGHYQQILGISSSLRQLLRAMIEVDPYLRITMPGIKDNIWIKCTRQVENHINSGWNEGLLESMSNMHNLSTDQLKDIISKKNNPTIFVYYKLLENKESPEESLETQKGPMHLKWIFPDIQALKKAVECYFQPVWESQYLVIVNGQKAKVKKVQNTPLLYLCLPTQLPI